MRPFAWPVKESQCQQDSLDLKGRENREAGAHGLANVNSSCGDELALGRKGAFVPQLREHLCKVAAHFLERLTLGMGTRNARDATHEQSGFQVSFNYRIEDHVHDYNLLIRIRFRHFSWHAPVRNPARRSWRQPRLSVRPDSRHNG